MLQKIKQHQILLLWGIIALLIIGLIIMYNLLLDPKKSNNKVPSKLLTTGVSRINPQEVWVHDVTNQALINQKRLDSIEQTLEQLLKINKSIPEVLNHDLNDSSLERTKTLREDLSHILQTAISPPINSVTNSSAINEITEPKNQFRTSKLKKISLNLQQTRISEQLLKTTDNNIPAGSFAKAILLGGVDASTSVQASSDPRPILLRLIDPGTLPRRFKSDLEGCHVLAASYGDLSSERVYMRLEKLGCVERKTGEIIEMNIQGYVAGEDGRAGIRGSLVDKASESMRHAMIGGFFSSIGRFLGQAKSSVTFSPATGFGQTNQLLPQDVLKQSGAHGIGGALDKYADFYIKRAEQMQPVIQVAAGRKVDIVFTQGTDFTDNSFRKVLSKTRDQLRHQQVQNLEDSKSIQDWEVKFKEN